MTIAETPSLIGHVTPNVKYSYSKADHLNYTKPTYIILTIDTDSKQKLSDYDRIRQIDNASRSGEKTYINKKDTPKSTINSLSSTTFNKQGQSYQQLSSLKSK